MTKAATVSMYFDKRGCAKGMYSVKWLVTFNRKQRLYATGILINESKVDFLKMYSGGLKGTVRDDDKRQLWKDVYETERNKALDAVEKMGEAFSFDGFKRLISGQDIQASEPGGPIITDNVFDWFASWISENKADGRHGNAESMANACNSLKRFVSGLGIGKRAHYGIIDKEYLKFSTVSVDFLKDYERWMLRSGKLGQAKKGHSGQFLKREEMPASMTTVGIYLRALRTLYNAQKFTKPEDYPFGRGKYTIPKGQNIKKALPRADIERIFKYEAEPDSYRQRSVDLWIFSYLSNGANFSDMLRITWGMVKGDQIYFIRSKTKNSTKGNSKEIVISLFPRSWEILGRWGNKDKSPGSSIWEFMKEVELSDSEKTDTAVNSIIGTTNDHMRAIAREIGITGDVRTYAARHSFATTLLRSEAPLAFISQSLGHRSITTTQAYLGSFEDEQTKKYLSALLPEGEPES